VDVWLPTAAGCEAMKRSSTKTWTDDKGRNWKVGVKFKNFGGRTQVSSIRIDAVGEGYAVTRTVTARLPFLDLFDKEMSDETINFAQWRQSRRKPGSHQGRASSNNEHRLAAEVRLAALKANIPVQRAVAEALGISNGSAGRRIMAARKAGFIPPVHGRRERSRS